MHLACRGVCMPVTGVAEATALLLLFALVAIRAAMGNRLGNLSMAILRPALPGAGRDQTLLVLVI